MRLIRALRDCKQRSLTVSKKAPTVSKKADCGYPLSRYTCRATRVAADFLDFIAFCRCSSGVALHPLKILVSHLPPPPFPGGVAPKFGSEKVSRYTGVSQLQLRVSRYTVQAREGGRTLRKGVFLPSKRLLSAFYNTPPSKNPSKNLCLY